MERDLLKKSEKNLVGFVLQIDVQSEGDSLGFLDKVEEYLAKGNYHTLKTLEHKSKKGLYRIQVIRGAENV